MNIELNSEYHKLNEDLNNELKWILKIVLNIEKLNEYWKLNWTPTGVSTNPKTFD